ncbi:RluA family pseudouridine synthase [Patescibacteria group bacterium]|nr:RluA family pseudouridine synthase [Patescibacteria group bacterium]
MNDVITIVSAFKDRLDIVLTDTSQKISRNQFKRLIHDGFVSVNGTLVKKPKTIIQKGDKIEYRYFEYNDIFHIKPKNIKLDIIYEDQDILVLNKKAGLTVHPGAGNTTNTLLNGVIFKLNFDNNLSGRVGIVHRLDKDTSGVIVLAKNNKSQDYLIDQFRKRQVEKMYIAIASGHLHTKMKKTEYIDDTNFSITGFIKRNPKRGRKFILTSDKGREAITDFKIIKYIGENTLLEVFPKTGRTHQIRVSLGSIYHPIVGDRLYFPKSKSTYMYLHAYSLGFRNIDGKFMRFYAPIPRIWYKNFSIGNLYKNEKSVEYS